MKTLTICTVTLTFGMKFKMTNTPFGSLRASSSLVNMTPLVYTTQNGSKVVGAALGAADGVLVGDELGVVVGDDVGDELGDDVGDEVGVDEGDADACDSVSKSQRPPAPEQPTIKL